MTIPGVTSTGSKRPQLLFGDARDGMPQQMHSSHGCIVHADGREYLDFLMALGAVALGYGHDAVNAAVIDAVQRGAVGPLPPDDEVELAQELRAIRPDLEAVRFLKSGAEAAAAAVRIARVHTGRDRVIGCGYHGWLDWCSAAAGVPASTRAMYQTIPFNDVEETRRQIGDAGDLLACVIVEPVVEAWPDPEWLAVLRDETARVGALLLFDEVKTAFRVPPQGGSDPWPVRPDLVVIGKAVANGYPLALVGGRAEVMEQATATWISSTLATEFVSLAAARASIRIFASATTSAHIALTGERLLAGLHTLATAHPHSGVVAAGIPQMCHLRHPNPEQGAAVARACARAGILFKSTAYNFVSLAHGNDDVDRVLGVLDEALAQC